MSLVTLVVAACFVTIYGRLIEKKSLASGIRYGAIFGLATGASMGFGSYSYMPIPLTLACSWFIGSWIEAIVAGAIVGAIVKPPERKRLKDRYKESSMADTQLTGQLSDAIKQTLDFTSIAGDFVSGTAGKLKLTSGPPVRMRLTEVDRNRSFTDETTLPLCSMKFEHHLVQEGQATRVVHRVSFSGPLAFFFGRVIGRQVRRGLPEALRRLKALAETH